MWKTTTYTKNEVLDIQQKQYQHTKKTSAAVTPSSFSTKASAKKFDTLQQLIDAATNTTTNNTLTKLDGGTNTSFEVLPVVRTSDRAMCHLLGQCLNISWTAYLRPELFFDKFHFAEPVYRIMNEQLLQQLQLLPKNYGPVLNTSIVTWN
jgi:hypothetical protein